MTERESGELEARELREPVEAVSGGIAFGAVIQTGPYVPPDALVELDDEDYEDIRQAMGSGTRTLLLGTSTRAPLLTDLARLVQAAIGKDGKVSSA